MRACIALRGRVTAKKSRSVNTEIGVSETTRLHSQRKSFVDPTSSSMASTAHKKDSEFMAEHLDDPPTFEAKVERLAALVRRAREPFDDRLHGRGHLDLGRHS